MVRVIKDNFKIKVKEVGAKRSYKTNLVRFDHLLCEKYDEIRLRPAILRYRPCGSLMRIEVSWDYGVSGNEYTTF